MGYRRLQGARLTRQYEQAAAEKPGGRIGSECSRQRSQGLHELLEATSQVGRSRVGIVENFVACLCERAERGVFIEMVQVVVEVPPVSQNSAS